ncbi:heme exporter protein CcmB [Formicincola oecophyllae]|nr:heme exporter protein CcmB [Formicincola oecophyllae]
MVWFRPRFNLMAAVFYLLVAGLFPLGFATTAQLPHMAGGVLTTCQALACFLAQSDPWGDDYRSGRLDLWLSQSASPWALVLQRALSAGAGEGAPMVGATALLAILYDVPPNQWTHAMLVSALTFCGLLSASHGLGSWLLGSRGSPYRMALLLGPLVAPVLIVSAQAMVQPTNTTLLWCLAGLVGGMAGPMAALACWGLRHAAAQR